MVIEPLGAGDWPAVRAIYEAGIATGNATFDTTVQTGIFPENQPSVRLHQACGFRVVGGGGWTSLLERFAKAVTSED
jgi:L-amino acid N-acyltransferase YncA